MKLSIKTLIIFTTVIGALFKTFPCSAKLDGAVSKNTFYDLEKTIMTEVEPDTTLNTGKYWEKNLFYINKYRPLFMLSNKDLYSLTPEKRDNYYQKVQAPMIYNISLKDSSIVKVSLSQPAKKAPPKTKVNTPKTASKPSVKTSFLEQKPDPQSTFLFEQAKNQGVDTDTKFETAFALKATKKPANYTLALDLLDDIIRIEPYNAAAYNLRAEIYVAKNDAKQAMQNYIEALNLNPYSKESCLGIAKILEPTNKTLAQKYYNRASQ